MFKFSGNRCYPQCESSRGRWQQKSSADHFDECSNFLVIDVIPNVKTPRKQQRTLASRRVRRSFQTQEAAEDVGSRRVRQIISKRRKQQRTLAAEEFGRSFQSNRLMVEAGRVCRMFKFSGNRCYPQCEDAGSSRTLAAEEFGRSFQSNRLMVEAGRE
ncbi:hypothetical protein CDAR_389091 [Caerostris darwini]|uniref:Uncharacterized protein n=1 Tax=Caerostris darwini TaxID=1538125 RepID=A0AAV4SPI2_9ARAC|nr:hypothetical protein CDAR_389091 [Caerostris darwini]